MKVDKEHMVIINSLTLDEAHAFVKFLESEILRHREDIIETQDRINQVILRFGEIKEW